MRMTYIPVIYKAENSKQEQRQGRTHVEWAHSVRGDSVWKMRFAEIAPLSMSINVTDYTEDSQTLLSQVCFSTAWPTRQFVLTPSGETLLVCSFL
ncbi:hypothetical protein ACRRTK_017395 [Alexandromys fortis]